MRKLNPDPYDYDSADDYYDDLDNYVNQGKCEPDYDEYDFEDESDYDYDYDKAANNYFDQIDRVREEKYR